MENRKLLHPKSTFNLKVQTLDSKVPKQSEERSFDRIKFSLFNPKKKSNYLQSTAD